MSLVCVSFLWTAEGLTRLLCHKGVFNFQERCFSNTICLMFQATLFVGLTVINNTFRGGSFLNEFCHTPRVCDRVMLTLPRPWSPDTYLCVQKTAIHQIQFNLTVLSDEEDGLADDPANSINHVVAAEAIV